MSVRGKTRISGGELIVLPPPKLRSRFAVERALFERRSIRDYSRAPLTLAELGQLLWSAQGITGPDGLRTTPSAGAAYPLEIYAAAARVEGLPAGVYHYSSGPALNAHRLRCVKAGQFGAELFDLTTQQEFIKRVAVNLVIGTVTARMVEKYGPELSPRFVHMEMGHAAQNLHLQAEALGLGSVAVGYLNEPKVRTLLGMESDPQYMVSIGRRKT